MAIEFQDNSKAVKKELNQTLAATLEKVLLIVESSAKANAKVGTGEMRDKIGHAVVVEGAELIGHVGSPTEHSLYNEFGTGEFAENGSGRKTPWHYQDEKGNWHITKGMKPRPFLRPAFRNNKARIKEMFATDLGAKFKKG